MSQKDYILYVLVLRVKRAVQLMRGVFFKKSNCSFKLWCWLLRYVGMKVFFYVMRRWENTLGGDGR